MTGIIPRVTVQFKAACSPKSFTLLHLIILRANILRDLLFQACIQPTSSSQRRILFIPLPPLALALHFYAQVSICKIRNFKNECQINASTA